MKKLLGNKKLLVMCAIGLIVLGLIIGNVVKQNKLYKESINSLNEVRVEFDKAEDRESKLLAYTKLSEFTGNEELNSSKVSQLKEVKTSELKEEKAELTKAYTDKVAKLTLADAAKATNKELTNSIKGLKEVNKAIDSEAILSEEESKEMKTSNINLIKSYNNELYINKIASLNKLIKSAKTSSEVKDIKADVLELAKDIKADKYLTEENKTSLTTSVNKSTKAATSRYKELKASEKEAAEAAAQAAAEAAAAEAASAQTYSSSNSYSSDNYSSSSNSGSSSSSSSSNNNSSNNSNLKIDDNGWSFGEGYTDGDPYVPEGAQAGDRVYCSNGNGCEVVEAW